MLLTEKYVYLLLILTNHIIRATILDKYLTHSKYEQFETIGRKLCLDECNRRAYCASVNYHESHLHCELNNRTSVGNLDQLQDAPGWEVIDMTQYEGRSSSSGIECVPPCNNSLSVCVELSSGQRKCTPLIIGCSIHNDTKNHEAVSAPVFVTVGQSYRHQCLAGYLTRGNSLTQTCVLPDVLSPTSLSVRCYKEYRFFGDNTSWALVFRAQSGLGISDYDTWLQSGTTHERDKTVSTTCELSSKNSDCKHQYRTSIIDDWSSLPIKKVKFALYRNDYGTGPVKEMTFNGTGSSYTSWFSPSRIISSSWADMTSSSTYVVFAWKRTFYGRRMEISQSYGGCALDRGFFISITELKGNPPCAFDVYSSYPAFVYCSPSTACVYDKDYATADVYIVLIDSDSLN